MFKWVFQKPRGRNADENPNVFYRHENVLLWDQMKRYDDQHGTGFAQRFDVEDPDSAPRMHDVEAEYLAHKSQRQPTAVIEQLLRQLGSLNADTITHEGAFLKDQLEQLDSLTNKVLAMVRAAEAA